MSDATIKIVSHEEGKVLGCSLLKLAENVGMEAREGATFFFAEGLRSLRWGHVASFFVVALALAQRSLGNPIA